jgi:hypothetical protein
METVNKLLEKVCLVTKISFKYFIFKISRAHTRTKYSCWSVEMRNFVLIKLELLFLLGHILQIFFKFFEIQLNFKKLFDSSGLML